MTKPQPSLIDRSVSLLDKAISSVSPSRGLARARNRTALSSYGDSGYIVPGSFRKTVKGWTANLNSPAKDIDPKLESMRAASRDLSMNSPVAISIFRRYKTNVVGPGLQIQPQVDKDYLNMSDDAAKELNKDLERNFELWSENFEADFQGERTFAEMQELLFFSAMVNGDAFFALPTIDSRRSDWPFRTTMRLIDADLVRSPTREYLTNNGHTNAKIRHGVEYNEKDQLTAYWISTSYRNEYGHTGPEKFKRIPVYDENGQRQIFSLMDHERIGQRRGIPFIAPSISRLKMIDRYAENEVVASTIAAMFTVFVRDVSNTGAKIGEGYTPEQMHGGGGANDPDSAPQAKNEGEEFNLEMGSANVVTLPDMTDVTMAEARKGRDEFVPFFNSLVTEVSAAANLPRDQVMLDFTKSYSALRGAALESAKEWKIRRAKLVRRCNQIVYETVTAEAVMKKRIKAPRFFDDPLYRKAYCRARWIGMGLGHLDPYKEALASQIRIASNLSTHEEEYQELKGAQWVPMIERRADEKQLIEDLGLAPDDEPDGRHEPNGGAV
jgi:lambda family phage portal protein